MKTYTANEVRDILKANGIKRTDVNVKNMSGSMSSNVLIEIRKEGFYNKIISLFDFTTKTNLHKSCSNALMA